MGTVESPPCCQGQAVEYATWRMCGDAWELYRLTVEHPGGCCSFLPGERDGEPYHSEAEAQGAADAMNSRLREQAGG